ncbi:hypothetical protein [Burkholderia plantarii]|uniref:Uncharacterized protein n=1 Tax=Burkholderia plantarii TaxID=41899 RepID=A0A0B6RSB5_BURPL|nr:hypothetical protein [Burkholderia plantarii]AJK46273.1 hypothetical protein BGL_1c17640 [Burkholderia plantarii]
MNDNVYDPGGQNLWNIADKINHIIDIKINAELDGKPTTLLGGKATTVILSINGALESEDELSDFYIVRQDFMFSPLDMVINNWHERGLYVTEYTVTVETQDELSDSVDLVKGSPQGAVGQTSVSSGTSLSFGGSVGWFGSTPTGGVNAGYSVSNSTSFVVSDVEIKDRCHKRPNVAQWAFSMPFVNLVKDLTNYHLSDPKNLSINTFQPTVYSIWRSKKRVGERFGIKTTVDVALAHSALDRGDSGVIKAIGELTAPIGIGSVLLAGNQLAYSINARVSHTPIHASQSFVTQAKFPKIVLKR